MVCIKCPCLNHMFNRHVNVIGGRGDVGFNSGSDKTKLFCELSGYHANKLLECNKKIYFLSNLEIIEQLSLSPEICLVVDEANTSAQNLELLFEKVYQSEAYLILIGRLFVKQAEYSVDAIFSIEGKNPYLLKPLFVELPKKYYEEPDTIITEDSVSVAAFYSGIFEREINSANGKNRIFRMIRDNTVAFIIADNAKFGPVLLDILERAGDCKLKQLYLFTPESFEEVLLSGNDAVIDEFVESGIVPDVFDLEKFCEERIAQKCKMYNKKKMYAFMDCVMHPFMCERCRIPYKESELLKLLKKIIARKDDFRLKTLYYTINTEVFQSIKTVTAHTHTTGVE